MSGQSTLGAYVEHEDPLEDLRPFSDLLDVRVTHHGVIRIFRVDPAACYPCDVYGTCSEHLGKRSRRLLGPNE